MKKAMVFAAGLGTRLKPLTNNMPKALVPYQGTPLLQLVLLRLKQFGFNYVVINVHHFAEKIIDFLKQHDNFGLDIHISDETNMLLETGGGLYHARNLLQTDEPILIHNVDILSDLDLNALYNALNKNDLAILATQQRPSDRVLIFSKTEKFLCGWKNKKNGEQITARNNCPNPIELAFSGIHVVSPRIFQYLKPGKYSIIQTYLQAAESERITFFDHSGGFWRDMGRPESFIN